MIMKSPKKRDDQVNINNNIIRIITLFKSQIILAKHKCSANWGDCKSNKSNQINQINQIKPNVGFFLGEGKTRVPGEKPLGAE